MSSFSSAPSFSDSACSVSPASAPAVSPASASLELSSVAFFGRSLSEYATFFALNLGTLRGRRVLDVAAGPSSFTAEAVRLGVNAIAVDPLYGYSGETLTAYARLDYERMEAQMRAKRELFRLRSFASMDEAMRARREAAERFLADYETGLLHGRYVGARLPGLPFADATFDVLLCAHLLFVYRALLDYEFHLEACRELVRVCRDEVRIHPVCGPDGAAYAELERLRRDLEAEGIESRLIEVDHEFFRGSDRTLVLRRA